MVNGPLDFLFRRPNNGTADFLVKGWRLPHFFRDDRRRTSNG